jgi:hypothetical protein
VLLEEAAAALPDGSFEAVATLPDPAVRYTFETKNGRMHLTESTGEKATARIEGTHGAWVAAFGTHGACAKLRVTGDRQLASSILAALHGLQ